jgi:hypothetical protein
MTPFESRRKRFREEPRNNQTERSMEGGMTLSRESEEEEPDGSDSFSITLNPLSERLRG